MIPRIFRVMENGQVTARTAPEPGTLWPHRGFGNGSPGRIIPSSTVDPRPPTRLPECLIREYWQQAPVGGMIEECRMNWAAMRNVTG
jgi:hypothetical protein